MEDCPPRARLTALLKEDLDRPETAWLTAHIERCGTCRESLAALTDDPEFHEWRRLLHSDGQANPPGLSAGLHGDAAARAGMPQGNNGFEPPRRIGGYEICGEVGSGAFGVVYLAEDGKLDRRVAVKVLRSGSATSREDLERFQREARTAASVRHDHVVTIHHVGGGDDDASPFLVMEYVEGGSLADRLHGGPLPSREAAVIARQVAMGLSAAHERGLVHRDVKPSNILIEAKSGRAKLGDFGIARLSAAGGPEAAARITHTGQLVGTPAYMSPEQIASPDRVDARSDVYAVGVVLFESLTGERPFRGTVHNLLRQIAEDEPPAPRRLNGGIPRDLETIILKSLEKLPSRRYPSAASLADDLGCWLDGLPIAARPVSRSERAWKWMRRRPALATLLAVCILSTVGFLATILTYNASLRLTGSELSRALDDRTKTNILLERQRLDLRRALDERTRQRDAGYDLALQLGISEALRYSHSGEYQLASGALNRVPSERRGWEWHRIGHENSLTPRREIVVGTHGHGVVAGILSPDGNVVVTSGQDGRVIAWDADGTNVPRELEAGTWLTESRRWSHAIKNTGQPAAALAPDCFTSLCWARPGKTVVGSSLKGQGIVWELDGRKRSVVLEHDHPLYAVASADDGEVLLFGDDEGVVIRCDRRTGTTRRLQLPSSRPVLSLISLPGGIWAAGQVGGAVCLIDDRANAVVASDEVRGDAWALALAPDDRTIAVAGGEAALTIFKLTGTNGSREIRTLHRGEPYPLRLGESSALQSVAFSADGSRVFAGTASGRLVTWDRQTHAVVSSCPAVKNVQLDDAWPLPLRRIVALIACAGDGKPVFTAGRDSAVCRWTLDSSAVTTVHATVGPIVRFDPKAPQVLWVAAADGSLSRLDTTRGRTGMRQTVAAHRGAIVGLDVAAKTGMVVTGGDDGAIRSWTFAQDGIRPLHPPIRYDGKLRGVAVNPDGSRVAACDADDGVMLFEAGTGNLLGRASMVISGGRPATRGLIGFNADGTLLAALGPGATCWVFDASTLTFIRHTGPIGGASGTALAWHPTDPTRLYLGDTKGRVGTYTTRGDPAPSIPEHPVAIEDLAFTPDGTRLAVLDGNGTFAVIDLLRVGELAAFEVRRRDPGTLLFDPTGTRLATVFHDGTIDLFESRSPVEFPPEQPPGRWLTEKLTGDESLFDMNLRGESIVVDEAGRLHLLYRRRIKTTEGACQCLLVLGCFDGREFREKLLSDLGILTDREIMQLSETLALATQDDCLYAVHRRPSVENEGELFLHRVPTDPSAWSNHPGDPELLSPSDNNGSYPTLWVESNGEPSVLHFKHDGHFFYQTRRSATGWMHEYLPGSLHGDGFRLTAVAAPNDHIHSLFRPFRFDADPSPLQYLRTGESPVRETLDRTYGSTERGLALSPDGDPIVLYEKQNAVGGMEMVIARRTEKGWGRTIVMSWRGGDCSNLTCDPRGTLRFAYCGEDGRVMLATGDGGSWLSEQIGCLPEAPSGIKHDEQRIAQMTVRISPAGKPYVVLVNQLKPNAEILLYRPGP